jgi:hypothetical protein
MAVFGTGIRDADTQRHPKPIAIFGKRSFREI